MALRRRTTLSPAEKAKAEAAARAIAAGLDGVAAATVAGTKNEDENTKELRGESLGARLLAALRAKPDSVRTKLRAQFYPWRAAALVWRPESSRKPPRPRPP